MKTVHNARTQLLGTLLNAMPGSSFTVGVAAPVAATVFYGAANVRFAAIIAGVCFWLGVAVVLHMIALGGLGGLRE